MQINKTDAEFVKIQYGITETNVITLLHEVLSETLYNDRKCSSKECYFALAVQDRFNER